MRATFVRLAWFACVVLGATKMFRCQLSSTVGVLLAPPAVAFAP